MPLFGTRRAPRTTRTVRTKHTHHTPVAAPRRSRGGIFSRRRQHRATPVVVHHQKRKPSMGDKISGALTRLRGSLTGRPGVKVRP